MDIPLNNLIPYTFENGSYILIPSPAAYCVHKILINDERTEEKRRKDSTAIHNILNSFIDNRDFISAFQKVYSKLGRKQRTKVKANAAEIGVDQLIEHLIEAV